MSDEIIKPSNTSGNSLVLAKSYIGNKTRSKFNGSCLKQDKITFTHGKTVNIYIVYELSFPNCRYDDYPVLESSLLENSPVLQNSGAVKLVKNAYIDKYKYSAYSIGFD